MDGLLFLWRKNFFINLGSRTFYEIPIKEFEFNDLSDDRDSTKCKVNKETDMCVKKKNKMTGNYYIGIDVGTGSVRAALIRRNGEFVKTSSRTIRTWNPGKDYYEQSSDDIWRACCQVVKDVSEGTDSSLIKGIGFDATCSLVCIGQDHKPLTISLSGNNEQNVILWMDHRAKTQADFINEHKTKVLKYVGGKISLEMETPKLMWIKENLKETWNNAKYFFDLADFLTWKATGDDSRSLCTVVCKWTYIAEEGNHSGWDEDYFSLIGLKDLLSNEAFKIGSRVKVPGEKCGSGLTESASKELGLLPGTCVGAGIIDAHAGGLGLLTAFTPELNPPIEAKIGLICGTSTCHMVVHRSPKVVTGVWGPYFSAMIPNMYLNEAGQSATGKLIDFVIETHPATERLKTQLKEKMHIHEYLNKLLYQMADLKNLKSTARLTSRLHIWPDFHGNRSPLADPSTVGMISGLMLVADECDLALKYLATIQSLAYGTRHILDTLRKQGYENLSVVLMCGGLSKNKLFVQVHADVLGLPVFLPKAIEPVLLGAGILGIVASGGCSSIREAIESIKSLSDVFTPSEIDREYHKRKFEVFLKMLEDQKSYDSLMKEFISS